MSYTNQQLADALGFTVRTVTRYLAAGMPRAAAGESLKAWRKRALIWKREHAKKRGRPSERAPSEIDAQTRYRLAKAELAELELARMKAVLHSRVECEEQRARQCAELLAAFQRVPDNLARRLYQAPSPDAIKLMVQDEIQRCFEVLADGGVVADAEDAGGTSVA